MELIDEIMLNIEPYITDSMAVSNSLYITLQHYSITKKSTELAEYHPEDNEYYIKKFLIAKKTKGCTDRTIKFYAAETYKSLERIGKNIKEITSDDIRLYIAKRIRDGVSNTTIGNEKRVLSSMFTYLHGEDIIQKNPMLSIDTMKQRKTQKEAFKDYEVVAMRNELLTTKDKAIFELLLSTGCRVSELVNIKLDEIQDDYSILVHGKGQKDRLVYMNAKTIQIMIDKRGSVTNGDVIRASFPNISIVNVFGGDIWFKVDNSYLQCSESWWDSPYKECDIE